MKLARNSAAAEKTNSAKGGQAISNQKFPAYRTGRFSKKV